LTKLENNANCIWQELFLHTKYGEGTHWESYANSDDSASELGSLAPKLLFVCFGFYVTLTQYRSYQTFQLYWWRKTSGALPCIISNTNGHPSRTTDVL
jgi:hypothetical protein